MSKFFILPFVLIFGLGGAGCSSKNKEVQAETVDVQKSFKFTPQELEKIIYADFKNTSTWEPLKQLNNSNYLMVDKFRDNTNIQMSVNSKNKVTKILVMGVISRNDFDQPLKFGRKRLQVIDTTSSILSPFYGFKNIYSPMRDELVEYSKNIQTQQQGMNYKEFHIQEVVAEQDAENIVVYHKITPS